ncbi:MAG TPA: hypothetical protein VG273_21500 [Bryobacteraceae bacterium]|jgi:hypothetical protein|nr:hypothetical protein [Bryobacteraceae bacterium]
MPSLIDLSTLEARVKSLNDALGTIGVALAVATAVVVIGLIVEYEQDFREFFWALVDSILVRDWRFTGIRGLKREVKRAVIGGLLVTVGVAAELRYEYRTSVLEGELESTNDQIVRRLGDDAQQLEARLKSAIESASKAEIASTRAFDKANKATASASRSLTVANSALREADTFETSIKSARDDAAGALASLAEAKQLAEEAQKGNIRNSEKIADRHLTPEQQRTISNKLRKFRPVAWGIVTYSNDGEAIGLAEDLKVALVGAGGAGWREAPMISITTSKPDVGVLVEYTAGSVFAVHAVAIELASALRRERLEKIADPKVYAPNSGTTMSVGSFTKLPPNAIIVTVARKP